MQFKIEYTVTEELQLASVKQYFFKIWIGNKLIVIALLAVLAVVTWLSVDDIGYLAPTVLTLSVFFAAVSWVKGYLAVMKQAKQQLTLLDSPHIVVEIDEQEIRYASSNTQKMVKWEKVEKSVETKDFLLLMKGKIPLFNFPKASLEPAVREFITTKLRR